MRPVATSLAAALLLTLGAAGSSMAETKSKGSTPPPTKGASTYAPGHKADCAGPGQSGCAPGQVKPDDSSAKTYAPGYSMKHPPATKRAH